MARQYLITAALPYANGYLHLGHIAGAYLPADLYARFLRLAGERVLFVCGSDEHGVAITIRAEQEGKSPREIVDHYHNANEAAFAELGMTFDVYGRTSTPEHHRVAQEWFLDFYHRGLLEERQELQFYDNDAGMFLPDRYVEGTCPHCGYERARGDQCEQCGAYYDQLQLINPRSLLSGKPPAVCPTTHWYFRLSRFQDALERYIDSHEHDWKENVLQQAKAWLKQGLGDRAITRDLRWGVPVPIPGAEGKVLYVWFEALLGYISATQLWAQRRGTPDAWHQWWFRSNEHQTVYAAFIGKDNIVFHALMFPAMLMARENYILPSNVPANEFLNLEGQKFSKSRNWSIELRDALADFPHHQDALRYALAMNLPETRDADFTWSDFQARTNNELAAIVGNYANRVLAFIERNFEGRVPTLDAANTEFIERWHRVVVDASTATPAQHAHIVASASDHFSAEERAAITALITGVDAVARNYRAFRFRDAVSETISIARAANKFFNDAAPWKTLHDDPARCARTLFTCMQILRALGIALAPVTPQLSERIQRLCGIAQPATGEPRNSESSDNLWATLPLPMVEQGTLVGPAKRLVEQITNEQIAAQRAKLGVRSAMQPQSPSPALITIEDFSQIELRTARILAAERVPKSQKLIKLTVDLGNEHRQIVAGIGKQYTPEELVGLDVVVVANLQPARLMGIESQGMLLAANDGENLVIVSPRGTIPPGSVVR
ncbi:MAG: methionine--tRNA ligase [Chlorobi bacterium]|nr:methionine--tRNA ligase [Chlorobiota bacterium]